MGRWDNSSRRKSLPADWSKLRQQVFQRDGTVCTWLIYSSDEEPRQCTRRATDVDHIKRGDDHSLENLRGLCHFHHNIKTQAEGLEARQKRWTEIHSRYRKQDETHPGLL